MSEAQKGFLKQLIGDWHYEFATADGSYTMSGTEKVWGVGEWIAIENRGIGSDSDASHSVTVLGLNAESGRFHGSFAGSMTPHLFLYDGDLSDDGATLPLETEGPAMTDGKATDRYRDVIAIIDADHRDTYSQVLETDGTWREFMRWRFERRT